MLKELHDQIKDIHNGSTKDLPVAYGHAIGVIAQVGRDEAFKKKGGGNTEAQIKTMRQKAKDEVIKFGAEILDFLRPEFRSLIEPENLDGLEKIHKQLLAERDLNMKK